MRKTNSFLWIFFLPLLACFMTSCNSNPPAEPKPAVTDLSMYVGDQKELPAELAPWSSTNSFIADIQNGTLLTAKHVGQIELNGKDSTCTLSVLPKYTYAPYKDPILTWGISKNELKKLFGNPNDKSEDTYTYYSSDRLITYDYYFYGEEQVLDRVRILFDKAGKDITVDKVKAILEERYCLIETQESNPQTTLYADCTKKEYEANKKNATTTATVMVGWLQAVEYRCIR